MVGMKPFEEDYGTLWSTDVLFSPASNITELWWDEEMQALLNLHLASHPQEKITSDYEKFRFLCERMPYLKGHPVSRHCRDFLHRYFACDLPMETDTCEAIWAHCADVLQTEPRSVSDLFSKHKPMRLLWSGDGLPEACGGIIPIPTDHVLLPRGAVTWQKWLDECTKTLDRFAACGADRVYMELQDDYVFCAPDPYHVGVAAEKERRSHEDNCILVSQLFRHLSVYCQRNQWAIYLSVGACGGEAVKLLSYAEGTVGLSRVLWSTENHTTRDTLTAFAKRPHSVPVLPVIRLCDHPSDVELTAAIEAYAARYPTDLLRFACGGDLRHAEAERTRLYSLMPIDDFGRKEEER